jgi:molecular chaperone GrpE
MSDFPSPPVAGNAAEPGQEVLTPEAIESILADFRSWLQQLAAQPDHQPPAIPQTREAPDLHTLLAQFVALRHEVNLQTKASRVQQEQNAETLDKLTQALEALQQHAAAVQQADQQALDEQLRPLLKTLVDLYDSLALARREVQRVQEAVLPLLDQLTAVLEPEASPALPQALSPSTAPPTPAKRSWWARLFGGTPAATTTPDQTIATLQAEIASLRQAVAAEREQRYRQEQERRTQARQTVERLRQMIVSVVTGYTMSLQRVERSLHQYDLEPIAVVGQPFDPETMEVVEVVTESGRTTTEVIEEVRRGYLWRGAIFRFAQVRVARPVV